MDTQDAAIVFKNDAEYLAWCQDHPEAYVLNFGKVRSRERCRIHKAYCHKIATRSSRMSKDSLTWRSVVKVGAYDCRLLVEWLKQNAPWAGVPQWCVTCQCSASDLDPEFAARRRESCEHSDYLRRQRRLPEEKSLERPVGKTTQDQGRALGWSG